MDRSNSPPPLVVHLNVNELEALVRGVVRDELLAAAEQRAGSRTPDPTTLELEPLLTASQLADVLNCGVRTLKRWLQEGVAPPPTETPGSRLRWYKPAVRRWLEQHCPGVAESPFARGDGMRAAKQPESRWRKVED